MLLLLSNTPGRLLPTIRSRCQRLDLRPLDDAALAEALKRYLPESDAAERASLARLSGGSIGAALTLATGEGAALAAEADRLIDSARGARCAGAAGAGRKAVAHPRRAGTVRRLSAGKPVGPHSRHRRDSGARHLERWMALLARLDEDFARAAA